MDGLIRPRQFICVSLCSSVAKAVPTQPNHETRRAPQPEVPLSRSRDLAFYLTPYSFGGTAPIKLVTK